MAGMYEYENQLADLQSQYGQTQAAQEYGRFVGQQRYTRDKQGMSQNFQKGFGNLTGGFARRGFGNRVRSGRVGADMGEYVNRGLQSQNDLDNEFAGFMGNQQTQATNSAAAYQGALQRLMEQMKAVQAAQSPFAPYQAVNQ